MVTVELQEWGERRYRLLFETVDEGVLFCDSRGVIVAANPKALSTFGIAREEATGKDWEQLDLQPIDESGAAIPLAERPVMRALRTGEVQRNFIMGVKRRDGTRRWLRIQAVPLVPEGEDRPCEAYSIFADITEEKEKRERLELLRSTSESLSDLIFAKDRDLRLIFANRAYLEALGRSEAEVLGKTDAELLGPDIGRAIMERDRQIMESGLASVQEERRVSPDGEPRFFMSNKAPYRDERGAVIGLLGISRDVTERRRHSEESERSRRQLEAVFQAMSEAVVVYDMSGAALMVNRAAKESVERSGDPRALSERLELFLADGTQLAFEDWPVSRVLRGESLSQFEVRARYRDSGRERYLSFGGEPVRDKEGRQILGVVVRRDITEAKRIENALREADRRKDDFLSMLSHELRTPLAPMRNAAYMLNHCMPGSEEASRARLIIERQVGHLTRLVEDLLDVTRIARGKAILKLQTIDLCEVVRQLADDFRETIGSAGLRLEMQLAGEPVWVRGDATRLAQVISNLLQNAVKFTAAPGLIRIELAARDGTATVRVRDSGAGIDPAMLDSIFDPFTQGPQEGVRGRSGLGLGLALVKGFTELHGGTVQLHSDGPGKGTEFTLRFPLVVAQAETGTGAGARSGSPGKRVLVVDDDHDSADTLAAIVRLFGHEA